MRYRGISIVCSDDEDGISDSLGIQDCLTVLAWIEYWREQVTIHEYLHHSDVRQTRVASILYTNTDLEQNRGDNNLRNVGRLLRFCSL